MKNNQGDLAHALLVDNRVSNASRHNESMQSIDPDAHKNKLGTINGCYVPCLLNIMGIILFERLGWGIGQVGVSGVVLIFLIAESQAIITVLSLCAIVTNGKMRGGGSYYMISRSLGPEFGGSIGILFYAAYCVGVAFYSVGFAEEIAKTWFMDAGEEYWLVTGFASAVLFVCLIIALIGASCFTKINIILFFFQFLGILIALLACFLRGQFALEGQTSPCMEDGVANGDYMHFDWSFARLKESWEISCSSCMAFAATFGVLFPAATGIMEGANLSGDLKNPTYSIPVGTLSAIATSITFYLLLIVAFSGSFNECTLRNDTTIMQEAAWGTLGTYLVIAGVIISASSSALGSLFGGSRVLQAIARDKLFPYTGIFEYGSPKGDEPRVAVVITWLIAQSLVFVGGIDVIAPISTSFFCLSYATVNFSCFLLAISGTPNFRPSFKYYSWHLSLIGTLSNLTVMFYVDWKFGFVAFVIEIGIFGYLIYRQPEAFWGDVTQSLMFHQVRKYLLRLDERKKHSKSWRPSILLLTDAKYSATIDFCNNLKKGGLYIIGVCIHGEYGQFIETTALRKAWIDFIDQNELKAFPQINVAPNMRNGLENLILLSGLGALQPNTIIVPIVKEDDYDDEDRKMPQNDDDLVPQSPASMDVNEYTKLLQNILAFHKNIIITANFGSFDHSLIVSNPMQQHMSVAAQDNTDFVMQSLKIDSSSHALQLQNPINPQPTATEEARAQWIDVWLFASDYSLNLKKIEKNQKDNVFPMLMMQLSHILLRNKVWSKAKVKLRVILCVKDANSFDEPNFHDLLRELRLNEVNEVMVVEWPSIAENDNTNINDLELERYYTSLNEKIKTLSNETYLLFMKLPPLPPLSIANADANTKTNANRMYYKSLQILLQGLPPTALVQTGEMDPVISTDL